MLIFPAIDIYEGKAVRLLRGDYGRMTVYGDPVEIAEKFKACGAGQIHVVDLEGAKNGGTPNFSVIKRIKRETGLFCEVGGGIRDEKAAEKYSECGIDRLIFGTVAVTDPEFSAKMIEKLGEKAAFGVDVRDGRIAVKGWTETTELNVFGFCKKAEDMGVKTVICTDISKDGAMSGTNTELYRALAGTLGINIIASGGVSSLADVISLRDSGLYGAIIGKAYYEGAVKLEEAIEAAR